MLVRLSHARATRAGRQARLYAYYRCNGAASRLNNVRHCDMPGFRVATWDGLVWDFVHDLMLHPEKLQRACGKSKRARQRQAAGLLKRLEQERAKVAGYDADLDEMQRQLYQKRIDRTVLRPGTAHCGAIAGRRGGRAGTYAKTYWPGPDTHR